MAIIAILATAGLSAYTGYIKKARDTTRIADLNAINTILLWTISLDSKVPLTIDLLNDAITNTNNAQNIRDPIYTGSNADADYVAGNSKSTCRTSGTTLCAYQYKVCDSGTGYAVATALESSANDSLLTSDDIGDVAWDATLYELGSCNTACTTSTACGWAPALVSYTAI